MSLQWNTNNIYTLYKGSHKLGVMRSAPVSHTDLFPRPWRGVARNIINKIIYKYKIIIKLVTQYNLQYLEEKCGKINVTN